MTSQPSTVRAFVAVELPTAARAYLAEVQRALQQRPAAHDLRFVSPDSLHLTLQFLGDIPEAQVPAITKALEALDGVDDFWLSLGGVGWFPARGPMRVLWMGLEGELEALATLQKAVERSLTPLGFKPEARPFSPHLTLARVRQGRRPTSRDFEGASLPETGPATLRISVEAIVLMRSDLRPQGALYTPLWKGTLG